MTNANTYALIGAGVLGAGLALAAVLLTNSEGDATADPALRTALAQPAEVAAPAALISSTEAEAWAQARAADTAAAYQVYLAAYPAGAFSAAAIERLAAVPPKAAPRAAAPAARAQTVAAVAPAPRRQNLAAVCEAHVDATLSAPSRTYRTAGGAAAGCAVGALAGGDDGRNCLVGAIAGGAAGAISAESRERRRAREVQACIAAGGPA